MCLCVCIKFCIKSVPRYNTLRWYEENIFGNIFQTYPSILLGRDWKMVYRTCPQLSMWKRLLTITLFSAFSPLQQLMEPNLDLLRLVFGMLLNIKRRSSTPRMTAHSLSVCTAPSLLCLPSPCDSHTENEIFKEVMRPLPFPSFLSCERGVLTQSCEFRTDRLLLLKCTLELHSFRGEERLSPFWGMVWESKMLRWTCSQRITS